MLIKHKVSCFRPKYKICAQSINRVWLNKNSRFYNFYYLRGKFLKPKGRKRTYLRIKNLKWTVIRNRMLTSLFKKRNVCFKHKKDSLFLRSYFFNLQQKQQLKKFYGKLQEQKLLSIFIKNNNSKISNYRKQTFISILEGRLDVLLLRAKLVPTINFSHQFINHNGVLVNEKLITMPNYSISCGDIVRLDLKFWKLFYKQLYKKVLTRVSNTVLLTYIRGRRSFFKFLLVTNHGTLFKLFKQSIWLPNAFKLKNLILILNFYILLKKINTFFNKFYHKFNKLLINNIYLLEISLYLQNIVCQLYYYFIINCYFKDKKQVLILKNNKAIFTKFSIRLKYLILHKNLIKKLTNCIYKIKIFFKGIEDYYLNSLKYNFNQIEINRLYKKLKLKVIFIKLSLSYSLKKMKLLRKSIFPQYLKLKKNPVEGNVTFSAYFGMNLKLFLQNQLGRRTPKNKREQLRLWKRYQKRLRRNKYKKNKQKYIEMMVSRQKSLAGWSVQSHWYIPKYLEVDFLTLRIGFVAKAEENEVFYPFNFSFEKLISFLKNRSY